MKQIISELRTNLCNFDKLWTRFEQLYVLELMLIEKDARSRIVNAIELEKEIQGFEIRERLKGKVVLNCEAYNDLRRRFVEVCGEINSVANSEGKGRDDLTVDILVAAEGISRRISEVQSRAVRKLADQIKKSFNDIRQLLRKYQENIELVDPQLKSNPELVDVLTKFEKAWGKGKEFFLDAKVCNMLLCFSQVIEGIAEKYKDVMEKIDNFDTEIFVLMPCLVVLSSLDGDDKGICEHYYPSIHEAGTGQQQYVEIKERYESIKRRCKDGYELYNIVEQAVLDKTVPEDHVRRCRIEPDEVRQLVHGIKEVAMSMQRHKPSEWNALMEAAMGQI